MQIRVICARRRSRCSKRNLREICRRFRVKQDQPTNRVTYRAMCTQLEVTIEEKGVNINKVVNTRASTMWKWAWAAMRYRWVSDSLMDKLTNGPTK